MAPLLYQLGNPTIAQGYLTDAERLVGEEESAEAAQVHSRVSKQALLAAQIRPALDAATRTIAIAEKHGPQVILVEAMTTKALAIGVLDSTEAGVELARHARDLARDGGFVSHVAATYRCEMLVINFRNGRTEACIEASRQGLAYAEQHCGPRWRAEFRLDLSLGYVEAGRVHDATPLLEQLLESDLDELRRLTVLQVAGLHALTSGALGAADTYLADATEIADRYQSAQETGYQFRLVAELSRRRGNLDAADDFISRALELQLLGDNLTYTRESIVEKLRIARARLDRNRRAAPDMANLEQLVNGFSGEGIANEALRSLMELELSALAQAVDTDAALETITQLKSAGFSFDAAQAQLLLIEELLAVSTGHPLLESQVTELWTLANTLGMDWIAERAASLAKAARLSVDIRPQDGVTTQAKVIESFPHDLTEREVEVMSLLAEGLTNKAIGERLFVSPRTVGTHVSNLLSKLALGNRGEAAAAFHRLGLANLIDLRDDAARTNITP